MNIKDLTVAIATDLNAGFLPVFDITLDYFLETYKDPDTDDFEHNVDYDFLDLYDIVEKATEKIANAGENTPANIIENSIKECKEYNARFFEFWSNHYYHSNGENMQDLLDNNQGAKFLTYIIMQQAELLLDYLTNKYNGDSTAEKQAIVSKLMKTRRLLVHFDYIG